MYKNVHTLAKVPIFCNVKRKRFMAATTKQSILRQVI